ncbi:PKD domain protein [compost metagenome]
MGAVVTQTIIVNPIPTPAITVAPSNDVCEGTVVTLTATGGTTYQWRKNGVDLAGATGSTLTMSTVAESGSYTVVAMTAKGCDEESAPEVITIYPNPVASFTMPQGCSVAGDVFTSTSTVAAPHTLTYAWDLGEGFTSTLQNPAVPAYTTAGPKTITLTVTSSGNGCTATYSDTYQYNGTVPVAAFTVVSPVCQGTAVQLDASASTTGVSPIVEYIWSFSQGGTVINTVAAGNSVNPSVTFPEASTPQTYDVTLQVKTQGGCVSAAVTHQVTVNPTPVAILSLSTNEICVDGGMVTITSAITNGVSVVAPSYTTNAPAAAIVGNQFDPAVAGVGTWTITYTPQADVANGSCVGAVVTQTIIVNPIPTPAITVAPSNDVCEGTVVTLTATGGTTYQWRKNGVDLAGATGSTLTMSTVAESGSYTVVAMTAKGCDEESAPEVITIYPNPVASFTMPQGCSVAGDVFTSTSTVAAPHTLTYAWDLGEGFTSTLQNPAVPAYTTAGPKTITLTVTSSGNGCTATYSDTYQYNGTVPVAAFTVVSPVCQGTAVQLDASASTAGIGTINDYRFEVFDAGVVIRTVNGTNPVQQITLPVVSTSKTYQVQLTVTTVGGCANASALQNVTVNPMPEATVDVKEPNVCAAAGKTVDLTNWVEVSNGVASTITYSGTGVAGNTFDPNAAGVSIGVNTISYTVTATDGGCTLTGTFDINVRPLPVVTLASNATATCEDGSVTLTASVAAGTTITSYNWYRDGVIIQGENSTTLLTNVGGNYTVEAISNYGCTSIASTAVNIQINPVPVAKFDAPSTCASAAGTVFDASASTITSPGTIARYIWNFGDGTPVVTVTTPTVTHAYSTVGQFNVSLTVESGQTPSCSASTTQQYTFVGSSPVVDFNIVNNAICDQDSIHLQSTATVVVGSIKTYDWQFFENGKRIGTITKNLPDVYATFPKDSVDRNYEVKLVVTTVGGCVDSSALKPFTIKALPKLVLDIVDRDVCLQPGVVTINVTPATGGVLTGTGIIAGTNQFDPMVAGLGKHAITFAYTNPVSGCSRTITDTIAVWALPTPIITASGNDICKGDTVTLSTQPASSYKWYQDGTIIAGATESTLKVFNAGTHNYTVEVENEFGCSGTASTPVTINIWSKPIVDFDLPDSCLTDTTVFVNKSTSPDGSPMNYFWSFEDDLDKTSDVYSTDKDGKHFYMSTGPKKVKLIVTTDNGCVDSLTKVFNVKGDVPVVNWYLKGRASVCAGDSVTLRDTSKARLGYAYDYKWRFFDGPMEIDLKQEARNEITVFVPEIYAGKTLSAELTVTPIYGCPASYTGTFVVYKKPTVSFKLPVDTMCVNDAPLPLNTGTPVGGVYTINTGKGIYKDVFYPDTAGAGEHIITYTFTDPVTKCYTAISDTINVFDNPLAEVELTTQDSVCTGDIVKLTAKGIGKTYQWFRNNVLIAGATASTYDANSSGYYQVRIINDAGCEDKSDSVQVRIWDRPVALFDMPSSCMEDAIQFNNTSSIADGTTLTYLWNFGDGAGSTSTQMNPSYTFKTPGWKHITLTVTSIHGCDSTFARDVMISGMPTADFVINAPQPYCVKDALVFEDKSTVKIGKITSWQWKVFDATGTRVAISTPTNTSTITFNPPVATVDVNYTVRLIVKSGNTCIDSLDKVFTVKPSPDANLAPLDPVCFDVPSVTLNGGTPPSGTGIGSGEYSGIGVKNGAFYPQKAGPGLHTITYTFTAANFCKDTAQQQIRVYQSPVIDCMDFEVKKGQSVKLDIKLLSNESDSYTYRWEPAAGLDDPNSLTPTVIAADADKTYRLIVTNKEGCISTCNVHVNVLPDLNIPDVITPNGDGKNDKWEIPGIEKYPDVEVYVFNRYGDKIFSSKGYVEQWDGTRDGKPVPAATYYYVIKPNKDQLKPRAGAITIIY